MSKTSGFKLPGIGVYGFDKVEPVIIAALVTQDPLLLIGETGTGKTFLLNSLSEALGLEHRHYNASLISFDDLVGFPFPDETSGGVRFLETPATVWGAESVLIDEISRCKPEHQNRLFSLIHERRLQGISLTKLKYRWAAMNPCSNDQSVSLDYTGSEPLDPALADRFSLFVRAVDWDELSEEEQLLVAQPSGEGQISDDGGGLKKEVQAWREEFLTSLKDCPQEILGYVKAAATLLNASRIRISPRRTRLLSRSLLAATIVTGRFSSSLFKLILTCSLPQATWGEEIKTSVIAAVHQSAWESITLSGDKKWVNKFHQTRSLAGKLELLVNQCPTPDAGTQAIEQFIASESHERTAVLAFAAYPAAILGKIPVGAEAIQDLGRVAVPILSVDGEISWQHRIQSDQVPKHPDFVRFSKVLGELRGTRKERAAQFFNWCLVSGVSPQSPSQVEEELHTCITYLKSIV